MNIKYLDHAVDRVGDCLDSSFSIQNRQKNIFRLAPHEPQDNKDRIKLLNEYFNKLLSEKHKRLIRVIADLFQMQAVLLNQENLPPQKMELVLPVIQKKITEQKEEVVSKKTQKRTENKEQTKEQTQGIDVVEDMSEENVPDDVEPTKVMNSISEKHSEKPQRINVMAKNEKPIQKPILVSKNETQARKGEEEEESSSKKTSFLLGVFFFITVVFFLTKPR